MIARSDGLRNPHSPGSQRKINRNRNFYSRRSQIFIRLKSKYLRSVSLQGASRYAGIDVINRTLFLVSKWSI